MTEFDLEEFAKTADSIRRKAIQENRLVDNPSDEELRLLMEKEPVVRKTIYGNFVAESEPSSRAAMFTKNSVDHSFGEEERQLLAQCEKALAKEILISVDRIVGNRSSETTVRLIVPEGFAHVEGSYSYPQKKRSSNQHTKSCFSLTELSKRTKQSHFRKKISP
jgi:phosphoenolpyruvate carboxykinase (ATP)